MKGGWGYAVLTLGVLTVAVGLLWPLLPPMGRTGVAVAAGVAWPIQVAAFALLLRMRRRPNGFLAAWAGGMLVRLALVAAVAVAVTRSELPAAPTLLALAGFLFVMLLLEPLFLGPRAAGDRTAGADGTRA